MIFKWLIIRDFAHWPSGIDRNGLQRMVASLEKSYTRGHWDMPALSELIQYGLILGLDMQILDAQGKEIVSSQYVVESLSGLMRKQITRCVDLISLNGNYERRPLFAENRKIGTFKFRFFRRKRKVGGVEAGVAREKVYRISLWIAALGAMILSLLLSGYVPD